MATNENYILRRMGLKFEKNVTLIIYGKKNPKKKNWLNKELIIRSDMAR